MAKATCSKPGCERDARARGMCRLHYQRWRAAGGVTTPRRSPLERFMAKVAVNPETGCWEWTACRVKNGYGRFGPTPGLVVYAHRYSWETFVGPIPPGLEVLHHCDNPRCVFADPDPLVSHLFLGDAQINNEDMWNKGRARPQPAVEPCGTYAAYRRHQRAGEVPCGPCREAFLEWMREYHRRTGT